MCVAIVQFNMFRKDCSCILAVLQRDDLCMQPHLGAAAAFREGFTDPCLADVQSVYLFSPCLKHLKSLLKVCSKVQTRNVSPCLAMSCLDFLIKWIWRRWCCAICTKNLAVLVIPGVVPQRPNKY